MLERTAESRSMEKQVKNLQGDSERNEQAVVSSSRLVVISILREKGKKAVALCRCLCGSEKHTLLVHVKSGAVRSCGCLKKETSAKIGFSNRTHGHSSPKCRSPEYRSWESMKSRCYNNKNPDYPRYGGRGISVCEEWKDSFPNFFIDMGARPKNTTLDRINFDDNYKRENCRWAAEKVQQRNKATNRIIEYGGEKITLIELSEKTGAPYQRLHDRIFRRGWTVEDAISTPPRGHY